MNPELERKLRACLTDKGVANLFFDCPFFNTIMIIKKIKIKIKKKRCNFICIYREFLHALSVKSAAYVRSRTWVGCMLVLMQWWSSKCVCACGRSARALSYVCLINCRD